MYNPVNRDEPTVSETVSSSCDSQLVSSKVPADAQLSRNSRYPEELEGPLIV